MLPVIMDEATTTLRLHLGPCLLAKLCFQQLEESFIDKDRAAKATWIQVSLTWWV